MRIVVTALAMALLTGCATINESSSYGHMCGLHPYCGVTVDMAIIKDSTTGNAGAMSALAPFAIIDLPFSFVADTLILPYTIFHMKEDDE
ncbi:YceK/YidQ family lipoprotein [Pseudomonas sp. G2-4]|uniref:YceK/YidQ family lipoprotein n=1 Tax=Pseudomonas sp. G2-4 TaxID=1506334 RepID=UPI0024BAF24B|nr:YceK/YidQ family lipoprotein [Pseudomonas sp. G2-4]WHS62531.1 YceK/YidQ family lipoprotein [Pseudomonas sp. G2-4]